MPDYRTDVIVMRHGESQANVDHIIASNPVGLGKTVGLTHKGHDQARTSGAAIAALIAAHPHKGTIIVTSPFKRATETAEDVADVLNVVGPTIVDPRFKERFFGVFEGLSTDNYEKIWTLDRQDKSNPDWNVETLESVYARTQSALKELMKQYQDYAIVIVTHGDVASNMIASAKGVDLKDHREAGSLPAAGFALLEP